MTSLTTRTASALLALGLASVAAADGLTTFENGAEGWTGPQGSGGSTVVELDGGNPGGNMHTVFTDFGLTYRNNSNPDFVMDYAAAGTATFSVDVKVEMLEFLGLPLQRPWVIELRDYDNPPDGLPWTSVWHEFTWFGPGDWTTWSVTIDDTTVTELPAGWGGYGAENEFGEPMLPADRTFTDVLASVDEVVFTTLEPGFFFSSAQYDIRLDNISVVTGGGSDCPADLDGTGDVGFDDLVSLLAAWGTCAGCPADIDGNGDVGFSDLVSLLAAWGPCP